MLLTLDLHSEEALQQLRLALAADENQTGEVRVRLCIGDSPEPTIRLGGRFALDGELAERLAQIDGLANVALTTQRGAPRLRLVA
jgi:DNA polymerase-3 subunit alpha